MISTLPQAQPTNHKTGNRCGHDRASLRVLLLPQVWRPHASRDAAHAAIAELFRRPIARASQRNARSEVREDAILVAQFFCRFTDFARLAIRGPDGEGIPIATIARETGLSRSRVNAGIRLLTLKGFLRSWQPRDTSRAGTPRGLPARRYFTREFFEALGVLRQINELRKRKGMEPLRPSTLFSASALVRQLAQKASTWPPPPPRTEARSN